MVFYGPMVLRRTMEKPRLLANHAKHEKDTSPIVENSVILLDLSEFVQINSSV